MNQPAFLYNQKSNFFAECVRIASASASAYTESMKKVLGILVLGLLLSGNAYAEMWQMEVAWQDYRHAHLMNGVVVVTCIDGYKFVTVRANKSISVTQAFEERNGKSLPTKC